MASEANSPWTVGRLVATTQAVSGATFALFSLGHLAGHVLLHAGFEAANSYLLDFKRFYQADVVEPWLIFLPLAVHAVSSIIRSTMRPAAPSKSESLSVQERNWHRTLGWILLPLVAFHSFGTRIGPIMEKGKAYADKLDMAPMMMLLGALPKVGVAYIFILGTVGLIHSVYGLGYALQILGINIPTFPPAIRKAFLYLSPLLMLSTGLAAVGAYGPIKLNAAQIATGLANYKDKPYLGDVVAAKWK